jgi:DNA-binding Lrp family transcriptional regulator
VSPCHRRLRELERSGAILSYLLRIVTTDLAAYQALQDERLATLPGVQRMTSTLVMKYIVADRSVPT